MRAFLSFAPVLLLAVACESPTTVDSREAAPTSKPASRPVISNGVDARGRFDSFGAKLANAKMNIVAADQLASGLQAYEGKTVRVLGNVMNTCPKKGCWMNVGDPTNPVFVRFLDYAFFVPTKGAEGRPVLFEGKVSNKLMSVDEQRHYAEDAGDFEGAKKITQPKKIPFVMATGVRMYDKR